MIWLQLHGHNSTCSTIFLFLAVQLLFIYILNLTSKNLSSFTTFSWALCSSLHFLMNSTVVVMWVLVLLMVMFKYGRLQYVNKFVPWQDIQHVLVSFFFLFCLFLFTYIVFFHDSIQCVLTLFANFINIKYLFNYFFQRRYHGMEQYTFCFRKSWSCYIHAWSSCSITICF